MRATSTGAGPHAAGRQRIGLRRAALAAAVAAALVGSAPRAADAALAGLQRVATGLASPIFATHAPGDPTRLFIAERGTPAGNQFSTATIRILNLTTGMMEPTPFLSISNVNNNGEGGLLGLAFHPDYATNHKFYVHVTVNDSVSGTPFSSYIREYTAPSATSNVANTNFTPVLDWAQPQNNHNGGWIGFSPNDGYLYIMTGDGGNGNDQGTGHTEPGGNAQDVTNNFLGKILRVDVNGDDFPGTTPAALARNYAIPHGENRNPFAKIDPADEQETNPVGDDEIWAYGLRNPFRASFDRLTGDLWIGDVGQDRREEIDFQPAGSAGGENYGWRLREGSEQTMTPPSGPVGGARPAGNVDPVYDYVHSNLPGDNNFKGNSVVGGVIYRGSDPSLQGQYLFGDTISNRFWKFDPANPSGTVQFINSQLTPNVGSTNTPVAFGEDALGNVYIVALGSGSVFRINTDQVIGDFDGDGIVDGNDLGELLVNFGLETGAAFDQGDADGDGDVDGADVLAWQQYQGLSPLVSSAVSAGVPEPTAAALVAVSVLAALRRKRGAI